MSEAELMSALAAQNELVAVLSGAHRSLERAVFALVATHPDKPAFMERLSIELAGEGPDKSPSKESPEALAAFAAQRHRLYRELAQVVAGSGSSPWSL